MATIAGYAKITSSTLFAAGSPSYAAWTSAESRARKGGQFSQKFQSFFFRSLLAVRADGRHVSAGRPHAPINLHGEPLVDGIHQPGNMVLNVRGFDEFAAEIAGINDFQEIVEQRNDQGLVGKRRWGKMLELGRKLTKRIQDFACDCRNCGSIP